MEMMDDGTSADSSLIGEIETWAGRWATEAGERLSAQARSSLHVEYKDSGTANPVSEADREAEEFLYAEITRRFPDHLVIGEEGRDPGPRGAPFVWVVDPLDGTSNYLNGLSTWCVSVGVLWYGAPVVGAIWAPLGPDGGPTLFLSRRGGGTKMNGRPVHVNESIEIPSSRLACLPADYQEQLAGRKAYRAKGDPRTLGSIALELALTACGALQFCAFWVPRIWDVAAGVSLVLEAGGTVLRRPARDQPWHPFRTFEAPPGLGLRKWQGGIIAANPILAGALVERLEAGRDLLAPAQPSQPPL